MCSSARIRLWCVGISIVGEFIHHGHDWNNFNPYRYRAYRLWNPIFKKTQTHKFFMKNRTIAFCLFLATIITVVNSSACPVCFGAKDSPMTAGMNMAILTMLGIIGSVLMGFIGIFVFMRQRYKRLQKELSDSAYVSHEGTLKLKNEKGVVEWNSF